MDLEDLQDINNLNDYANNEEAVDFRCENRENCKTCNTDQVFYCNECNDGFTLQKIQDNEYGYCTPDLDSMLPEEASDLECENREGCF